MRYAQRIFSDDVDKPVGTCIYTGMQSDQGGYVSDMTVNRLAPDLFAFYRLIPIMIQLLHRRAKCARRALKVLDGAAGEAHGRSSLVVDDHLQLDRDIRINDVTMDYTAFNVLGPSSRDLMHQLTGC